MNRSRTAVLDPAALLAEKEAGTSISGIARKFGVARETVRRHLEAALNAQVVAAATAAIRPAISGETPAEVDASFKAAWLAATPAGSKHPTAEVQARLRNEHQAAHTALKKATPKATPKGGGSKGPRVRSVDPCYVEAVAVRTKLNRKLTPEMTASRRTLRGDALVEYLRATYVGREGITMMGAREHSYWVDNVGATYAGFKLAWDAALAAGPVEVSATA